MLALDISQWPLINVQETITLYRKIKVLQEENCVSYFLNIKYL